MIGFCDKITDKTS